jgi:hypothetical protein
MEAVAAQPNRLPVAVFAAGTAADASCELLITALCRMPLLLLACLPTFADLQTEGRVDIGYTVLLDCAQLLVDAL